MKTPKVPKVPKRTAGHDNCLLCRAGEKTRHAPTTSRRMRRDGTLVGSPHPQGWDSHRDIKTDPPVKHRPGHEQTGWAPDGKHRNRARPSKHRTPYEGRHRRD